MNKEKKILAIIPARKGSKRLPGKNIKLLAGKPLIAWTIEAAINSKVFDQVMVNTDDDGIAEISKNYGASVPFARPSELGSDSATSIDVIKHTLLWYKEHGIEFTEVVLLQPTSPLREQNAIAEAWQLYLDSASESVVSVCEVEHPIQWTYRLDLNGVMSNVFKDNTKRSQDYEKNYRLNGAIYISSSNLILESNQIISNHSSTGYKMDRRSSVDIDDIQGFRFAEFLLQQPDS